MLKKHEKNVELTYKEKNFIKNVLSQQQVKLVLTLDLRGKLFREVSGFQQARCAPLPPPGEKYVIGHHSRGWIGCLRDANENIWISNFLTNRRLVTTS